MENFGKKGKDKVTGFEGIITCKINYMYGCAQYGLTPIVDKDGNTKETQWFDEGRISIGEQVILPEDVKV